jgi:hypothetical protein
MATQNLYLFNPDHDLALANGNENFVAPKLARTFGTDMACLPMWYAGPGSMVLANDQNTRWYEEMKLRFPQLETTSIVLLPDMRTVATICPWGWNEAVKKQLSNLDVDNALLPTTCQLTALRELSHRKTTIEVLQIMNNNKLLASQLPPLPQQLSVDEAQVFAKKHDHVVLKAPWSGSGKGLFWINRLFPENALGWCRNIAANQGSIMGEQVYEKIVDFAMEYRCSNGLASFAGYSLFETDGQGKYKSNYLLSDMNILEIITRNISPELLSAVKEQLQLFITHRIAPIYNGYLGIDMMVYKSGHGYRLHPCVEINLRMTMGMVARIFYDNFVKPGYKGRFYVDYYANPIELYNHHRQQESTLQTTNGRIIKGYLSLAPITENTHYRIRAEIDC